MTDKNDASTIKSGKLSSRKEGADPRDIEWGENDEKGSKEVKSTKEETQEEKEKREK